MKKGRSLEKKKRNVRMKLEMEMESKKEEKNVRHILTQQECLQEPKYAAAYNVKNICCSKFTFTGILLMSWEQTLQSTLRTDSFFGTYKYHILRDAGTRYKDHFAALSSPLLTYSNCCG